MYVTQTYLGFSAKKAKAYVYFLSEVYASDEQRNLHEMFLSRASEFGLSTGEDVAVLVPRPGFEAQTLGDLRDSPSSTVQNYYRDHIRSALPGLLITKRPIDARRGVEGALFISFQAAEDPFQTAKALLDKIKAEQGSGFLETLEKLNKVFVVKPNLFGVGIDLNAALQALIDDRNQ